MLNELRILFDTLEIENDKAEKIVEFVENYRASELARVSELNAELKNSISIMQNHIGELERDINQVIAQNHMDASYCQFFTASCKRIFEDSHRMDSKINKEWIVS